MKLGSNELSIVKPNTSGTGYAINESYRPIAETLRGKFTELENASVKNILFIDDLTKRKTKAGKLVFAEISKIPTRWQEILEQTTGFYFEFLLTIYRQNTENMSRAQLVALIYHELRHIQYGELVGHDIEEWGEMYYKLGAAWATTLSDIPNLLSDGVDWESIEGPKKLFPATDMPPPLRAVKL